EGGAVLAGGEDVPQGFAHQAGAHGQAPGDALGGGDHVGLDAVALVGIEGAGAADAGLDLVHQQEHVPLLAEPGQALDDGLLHAPDAPSPWTSSSSTAQTEPSSSLSMAGRSPASA